MSESPAVVLPRAPQSPEPFRFPVLGTVAPVAVSVGLWLVTGSVFALMFAALGPITALAGLLDSRWASKRNRRRAHRRFLSDVAEALESVDAAHERERAELEECAPTPADILTRGPTHDARWLSQGSHILVCAGRGAVSSRTAVDRASQGGETDSAITTALDSIVARAAVLPDAPILVDATLGIGIVAGRVLGQAFLRGLLIQIASALSPDTHWIACASDASESQWLRELPHQGDLRPSRAGVVEFGRAGEEAPVVTVALSDSLEGLPHSCRIAIHLMPSGEAAIVRHPEREQRRAIAPSFTGRHEALGWARTVSAHARRNGIASAHTTLPSTVALGALLGPAAMGGRPSLAARVALGADGPVVLDLVEQGPHAVVGGTTGSGKSELLIAWVVAMAFAWPPEVVTFLLIDFKGGAAFSGLAALPHTVGTITDLDRDGASRALASLRAELAWRERALAGLGVRTIDDTTELARLVIVVDEFAAMLSEHPELHALFADLAARGRSLGVHLVLCTQRPAGVVRDAVLANADLRVSLRVNNRADSTALVGTADAAELPVTARGRAIVRHAAQAPFPVQFALAADADVQSAVEAWPGSAPPRRPWCEPLPSVVLLASITPTPEGVAFGLVDVPDQQRRDLAVWTPAGQGNLLVLGAPGTGKSTVLRALGAVWMRVPTSPEAAWDAVDHAVRELDVLESHRATHGEASRHTDPRVVTIDDLDAMLARFAPDYRAEFVDRLARVLREGGALGIHCAMSAQRLTSDLQALASLVPARLWLRHASRQDFVLAGASGDHYTEKLPPGGGLWQSHRVQVGWSEPTARSATLGRVRATGPAEALAIVTTRAAWVAERLAGGGHSVVELATVQGDVRELLRGQRDRVALIGDVEDWQSRWGALTVVREHATVLFHACSLADFRALTRSRALPPPLWGDPLLCWRLEPDGAASRTRLPQPPA